MTEIPWYKLPADLGELLELVADVEKKQINKVEKKQIKRVEKMLELHTHNSIPCYIEDENEGCVTCIKNKTLERVLDILRKAE